MELIESIKKLNTKKVKSILSEKPDEVHTEMNGLLPIHCAIEARSVSILQELLNYGTDVNVRCSGIFRSNISHFRENSVMQELIEKIEKIKKDRAEYTPLLWAADIGDIESGRVLLEHGADFNLACNDEKTPLMVASYRGYIDFVNLLLEYDVDLEIVDSDNWTALFHAVAKGNYEVVKVLLQKGANLFHLSRKNSMF